MGGGEYEGGAHARPAGLGRLRAAINHRLEETSFRNGVAICVAVLLIVVAVSVTAGLLSGGGSSGRGPATAAVPHDAPSWLVTRAAEPSATPARPHPAPSASAVLVTQAASPAPSPQPAATQPVVSESPTPRPATSSSPAWPTPFPFPTGCRHRQWGHHCWPF